MIKLRSVILPQFYGYHLNTNQFETAYEKPKNTRARCSSGHGKRRHAVMRCFGI